MNRVILLLQCDNPEQTQIYKPQPSTPEECRAYIINAVKSVVAVEEEVAERIFDTSQLQAIFHKIDDKSYPSVDLLRSYLSDFNDYRTVSDCGKSITVGAIEYDDNILGTVIDGTCIIDHDAIADNEAKRQILGSPQIRDKRAAIVACDEVSAHRWFVDNRDPKRIYDFDYDKHHKDEKRFGGPVVSSQPFSEAQIIGYLHKAVGHKTVAKNDHRRRCYKIDKDRIVVFCNENLTKPTYHGYVVNIKKNKAELAKIMKENLHRKIDKLK